MTKEAFDSQRPVEISRSDVFSPEGFNFTGYPQAVIEGFQNLTDEEAVERAVNYVAGREVEAVELQWDPRGYRALVNFGFTSTIIEWGNPAGTSDQYKEYGSSYYGPYGPADTQRTRAKLLASRLEVRLRVPSTV